MNIKDKKGSIALFVMIGMVFMSSFLLISYGSNLNKSKFVKEQYEMISDIYYNNKSEEEIYNDVYADLMEKNTKEMTSSVEYFSIITLNNTHEGELKDYKIYAGEGGLGFQDKYRKMCHTNNSYG